MPQRIDEWIGLAMMYPLVFLFVGGLLWAPVGAFICHRIARNRGLDTDRYASTALGYSALFFLPWIYLVARMLDKRIPGIIFYAVYVFFYLSWFALMFGYGYFAITEGDIFGDSYYSVRSRRGVGVAWLLSLIWLGVILFQALTYILSLQFLLQHHRWHRRIHGGAPRNILPGGIYIYPFALFLIWIIAFPLVWAVTYAISSP